MKKYVRLSESESLVVKFHLEIELARLNDEVLSCEPKYVGLLNDRINSIQCILSKFK